MMQVPAPPQPNFVPMQPQYPQGQLLRPSLPMGVPLLQAAPAAPQLQALQMQQAVALQQSQQTQMGIQLLQQIVQQQQQPNLLKLPQTPEVHVLQQSLSHLASQPQQNIVLVIPAAQVNAAVSSLSVASATTPLVPAGAFAALPAPTPVVGAPTPTASPPPPSQAAPTLSTAEVAADVALQAAQNVSKAAPEKVSAIPDPPPKCHLHKKPQASCKFCQRTLAAARESQNAEAGTAQQEDAGDLSRKLNFQCSPMLKDQILKSSTYKSLLRLDNLEELVSEIQKSASDTMDVYRQPNEPSGFVCCAFRIFTLVPSDKELRIVLDSLESACARCVGFFFVRFAYPSELLLERVEEFLLDDEAVPGNEELQKQVGATMGEYIQGLLLREKYFGTPVPRLPAAVRKKLEDRLAPLQQYRKRTHANKKIFGSQRGEISIDVEACIDGQWRLGKAVEVLSRVQSRLRVKVELEGSSETVIVPIGQVILRDGNAAAGAGRDRHRSDSPDWSRFKGKSDAEMVEELRSKAKEDAVCSNSKDYSRPPPRFHQCLAQQRERGSAEARLIEEETSIALQPSRRRQNDDKEKDDDREREKRRRLEEEDERQRKLAGIYEKYGQNKKGSSAAKGSVGESGPDKMRFG